MALLKTNYLEILSLITTILGLILLGEKDALGFLVFDVSLACQIVIFSRQKNRFLIFQMIILICFNTYNYMKWIGGI